MKKKEIKNKKEKELTEEEEKELLLFETRYYSALNNMKIARGQANAINNHKYR